MNILHLFLVRVESAVTNILTSAKRPGFRCKIAVVQNKHFVAYANRPESDSVGGGGGFYSVFFLFLLLIFFFITIIVLFV